MTPAEPTYRVSMSVTKLDASSSFYAGAAGTRDEILQQVKEQLLGAQEFEVGSDRPLEERNKGAIAR